MNLDVTLEHCPDDSYLARCEDVEDALATGSSREETLENLRQQVLYQVEYCPCSYVDPERITFDVDEVQSTNCSL